MGGRTAQATAAAIIRSARRRLPRTTHVKIAAPVRRIEPIAKGHDTEAGTVRAEAASERDEAPEEGAGFTGVKTEQPIEASRRPPAARALIASRIISEPPSFRDG
tara:strand:+ start:1177 stop:1491 length:315 start_codon:yes stop_codon:yes gene_type:complete